MSGCGCASKRPYCCGSSAPATKSNTTSTLLNYIGSTYEIQTSPGGYLPITGLSFVVSCTSSVSFSFTGTIIGPETLATPVLTSASLAYSPQSNPMIITNIIPASQFYISEGSVTPLTVVQNLTLSPGAYTLYLNLSAASAVTPVSIIGNLSVFVVSKY
jgi:hypothetical protein